MAALARKAGRKAFAGVIRDNELNSEQIEFLDMIISGISINGAVSSASAQLYNQPFTHLSSGGLSGLTGSDKSSEIMSLVNDLKTQATG